MQRVNRTHHILITVHAEGRTNLDTPGALLVSEATVLEGVGASARLLNDLYKGIYVGATVLTPEEGEEVWSKANLRIMDATMKVHDEKQGATDAAR